MLWGMVEMVLMGGGGREVGARGEGHGGGGRRMRLVSDDQGGSGIWTNRSA